MALEMHLQKHFPRSTSSSIPPLESVHVNLAGGGTQLPTHHEALATGEPKYPRQALRFGCTCQVRMPGSVGFIFLALPILAP